MKRSETILNEKSISFCPRCNQQFVRQQGTGDYVHECHSNATLQNESVLVNGTWQDYTGSDLNTQSNRLSEQGRLNTLQGTRAGIEGGRNEPRDVRGFPTGRYRTRQHLEYIDKKDLKSNSQTYESDVQEYSDSNA